VIFYNRISGDIGAYGKRLNAFIACSRSNCPVSFQGRETAMAFALRKHDSEFESQPIADINVTPLVDVMLVLLISSWSPRL